MADWNETTLRTAASWKAFKDGKSLMDAGAVSGARRLAEGWSGTVRDGKRLYKVAVKVISATHLETRCPCPENQSTGALCAHGIASGLAALKGAAVISAPVDSPAAPPVATAATEQAFAISLPVNWKEALLRGKFSATLSEAKGITEADRKLSAWLAGYSQPLKFPLPVHPGAGQVGAFLRTLSGHPRVKVGKTDEAVTVAGAGSIDVDEVERKGEAVVLRTKESAVRIDSDWWKISDAGFQRLGITLRGDLNEYLERLFSAGSVAIPLKLFLNELRALQEGLELPDDTWLDRLHFVPATPQFDLTIDGTLARLEATLSVRYFADSPATPGLGSFPSLPKIEGENCVIRDFDSEKEAVDQMVNNGFNQRDFALGKWELKGEESVIRFVTNGIRSLGRSWNIHEGEGFRKVTKQVSIVEPKIQILGSGEDWLSFNLSFESSDGSIVPASEIRRLLASGKSGSNRKVILSEDVTNLIEPMLEDLEIRQEGGHFVASQRSGEVIREIRKKLGKGLTNHSEATQDTRNFDHVIQARLRPYQAEGISWLLNRSEKFGGALLADDMGLGKTIQAIASIESLFEFSNDGLALVVATASLLGNWKSEFRKFAPSRRVRILHGPGRDQERSRVTSGEVLLTTYGTLPRDLAWYLKQQFKAIVVDEASLMRNPDTDHAKAIYKLDADVRIALTGTPIENGVRDLWSIFRFIQPGWLGTREQFKERYEQSADDPAVLARLRLKTSPFMLRRTKEEVAPDLPSKMFIEEYCDLSPQQQTVYRDLLVEGRKRVEAKQDSGNQGAARMQILTALLRLRQTCCDLALLGNERFNQLGVAARSAKLERLLELISEALAGNHKILVFSQFQTQLREIEKCLAGEGISYLKLDGQTSNRQELVDRFQTSDGPPVFLISLKAGGYGLNLTAADIVIHFDPWWNPAAEAQATDRAHRIGQTRPVTVYRMITRGTVEEKVVSLQNKKRRLAAAIDESGGGDAAGWSNEELIDLMKG
jgi:superfamily II DNA or RNA helicase